MGKRWKLLSRLSRFRKERHSEYENNKSKHDTEDVTKCDSDTSSSVVEKTHIAYHCTELPSTQETLIDFQQNPTTFDDKQCTKARDCCSKLPVPFDLICCGAHATNEINSGKTHNLCNPSHSTVRRTHRQVVGEIDRMESIECIYEYKGDGTIDLCQITPPALLPNIPQTKERSKVCGCSLTRHQLPQLHPSQWPQKPLLLRPKPNGRTRILGIRKDGSQDSYLWRPGQMEPWWDVLRKEWTKEELCVPQEEEDPSSPMDSTPRFCEYCVILPINNGCEEHNQSLVVDFETPLFEGTLLFRLRGTDGTTRESHNEESGYFAGKAIRYQAVIRGRFKRQMRFCDLVTGTRLDRPCGKLPPKWIMWTAMKVVQFFAPQLNAQIEKSDKPYVLSPLGSAPRTIIVEDAAVDPMNCGESVLSREQSEPKNASQSLLGRDNPVENHLERARARKRQLDQWFMAQNDNPQARTDKIYTFEFLQHLFDYQNFHIEVSNSMHAKVKDLLNGQPLQLMAEYFKEGEAINPDNKLWAFEIWNECLWDDATSFVGNANADR